MRCWFIALTLTLGASLLCCGSLLWRISDAIPYCKSIALGDLDGDGDLDAFLANGRHEDVEPNRIWMNDGRGRFRDSGQRLGKNDSNSTALGDLDGDGDLDVLLSNTWSPPGGEVLENDGHGRFTSRQWLGQSNVLSGVQAVALGDLDGDGDLDSFMARCCGGNEVGADGKVKAVPPYHVVWLNNGEGSFGDSRQQLGVLGSYGVALGDLDGDDDLDAFVANWPEKAETVWMNDGDGQFTDSGQRLGDLRGLDAALGDVDGDGDLDAFVGNEGADEVWLNNGASSFSNSGQALGDARTWHVTLGDVNGDGALDALVEKQWAAQIWLNDGHGIFVESKQRLSPLLLRAVALGDVDGDGDLDVVVGRARSRPKVWLNDGTGRFVPRGWLWGWAILGVVALSAMALWWFKRQRRPPEPAAEKTVKVSSQ
jgi:hypothetical protein